MTGYKIGTLEFEWDVLAAAEKETAHIADMAESSVKMLQERF